MGGAHGGGWWVWQLVNGEEVVVGGGRDFGSKRVFVSFGFSSKKVFVSFGSCRFTYLWYFF